MSSSPSPLVRDRAPDRSPDQSLALRLTDDQLDKVMRLCQPLSLPCRDALLRILSYQLRDRRDVGDGELHRIACSIIQENRLFDPPDLGGAEEEPQRARLKRGKYS
jgi:hypothetical protein